MHGEHGVSVCRAVGCVNGVRGKMVGNRTQTLDTEHTVYVTENCDDFVEATGSLNDFLKR